MFAGMRLWKLQKVIKLNKNGQSKGNISKIEKFFSEDMAIFDLIEPGYPLIFKSLRRAQYEKQIPWTVFFRLY